jgi:hypothetical protein
MELNLEELLELYEKYDIEIPYQNNENDFLILRLLNLVIEDNQFKVNNIINEIEIKSIFIAIKIIINEYTYALDENNYFILEYLNIENFEDEISYKFVLENLTKIQNYRQLTLSLIRKYLKKNSFDSLFFENYSEHLEYTKLENELEKQEVELELLETKASELEEEKYIIEDNSDEIFLNQENLAKKDIIENKLNEISEKISELKEDILSIKEELEINDDYDYTRYSRKTNTLIFSEWILDSELR